MSTLTDLQADLVATQDAITKAEEAQSYTRGGRGKTNAALADLYAERRRLRTEIAKAERTGIAIKGGTPT